MAGGGAVLIAHVAAYDRAQPLDVEVGVFNFERIEGPLDEFDAARESVFALFEFQLAADAGCCDNPV